MQPVSPQGTRKHREAFFARPKKEGALILPDPISLSDLPRALALHGVFPSYLTVWRAAVDGRIPAERAGGRWFVHDVDLPRIAATFTGKR